MTLTPLRRVAGRIKRAVIGEWYISAALSRMRSVGTTFNTVIDVGASDGHWTEEARKIYPDACYVLVEALPYHLDKLKAFAETLPCAKVIPSAAADHDGEVTFLVSADPFGGAAVNGATDEKSIQVPCVRLDTLSRQKELTPPYLIKLDTHGFELPILEGASGILDQTNAAIIEAYNFQLSESSVRFHELCAYMEQKGFRCFDIFDLMHREKDGALWQFDIIFLRAELSNFNDASYK